MSALDEHIIEYIREIFIPYKSGMLINITNNISDINVIPNISVHYDFSYVNSCLEDMVAEDSLSVDKEDKIRVIESNFKETFIAYLQSFGIVLDSNLTDELGLNFFNESILAIKNLYTLDKDELEFVLRELDNQIDNNNTIMANLLSNYCNLSSMDFFSVLEEVSDETLETLKTNIEKLIVSEDNSQTDIDIPVDVQQLITQEDSEKYLACDIVKKFILEDYRPDTFINNIKYVYDNLNTLTADDILNYGYYNIVFLLYITTSKEDFKDTLDACLVLENIKPIGNDQQLQTMLINKIYNKLNIPQGA